MTRGSLSEQLKKMESDLDHKVAQQTLHGLELEDNGIDMKDDVLLLVQCLGTISDQTDTA